MKGAEISAPFFCVWIPTVGIPPARPIVPACTHHLMPKRTYFLSAFSANVGGAPARRAAAVKVVFGYKKRTGLKSLATRKPPVLG